jgi:thiol-disulfide isomerase/thioredoxin
MRNSIVFSILFLLGFYFFRVLSHDQSPVSFAKSIDDFKIKGVPTFDLQSFDNSKGELSHHIGLNNYSAKVMLINFWATWCTPCVEEFPALIKLAKLHSEKGNLEVFAVSLDKDQNAVKKFIGKMGVIPTNFHILINSEGDLAHRYGTSKIPETYIINSKHKLLRKALGDQNWLSSDFAHMIQTFGETSLQ